MILLRDLRTTLPAAVLFVSGTCWYHYPWTAGVAAFIAVSLLLLGEGLNEHDEYLRGQKDGSMKIVIDDPAE
ncbi:hypothetical protein GOB93_17845 [Acetobacter musti]|uniref:Uncharacterized protein n=1 Tax=Acetobacter musti TaxID=864732 RepID=A0ABX0JXE7_9PROT|nr:hypothetical protein [Acetobacter musti]NHN86482.1 hypothetical protein [Acetobacter musti]